MQILDLLENNFDRSECFEIQHLPVTKFRGRIRIAQFAHSLANQIVVVLDVINYRIQTHYTLASRETSTCLIII